MRIIDLVRDRPIYSVNADQTVLEAAQFMVDRNIGAVPVLRDGELVGIFSERDLMKRVIAGGRSPAMTRVSEVMTPHPKIVSVDESLENCMFLMREHNFRHLPVCDGRKLVGLISLRDLMLREMTEKDQEVKLMRAYIQGANPE
jgi:CBS domain-containing protein